MDILFFAALAFYIFFKLNKQLGKIDDEEKQKIQEAILKKKKEIEAIQKAVIKQAEVQSVVGSSSTKDDKKESEEIISNLDDKSKEVLEKILKSTKVSLPFFINGAKSAFEMIIKSFSNGDLSESKFLLSDQIYKGFESAINKRKSDKQTLVTNIIAIEKAEIVSAMMVENNASIAVRFTSKQINYVMDEKEKVIEGKKDEINQVIDIWTFKKDVTSNNPNWIVAATSHE